MSKKTHRELFEEYCRDSYLEKTGKSGNTSKTICLDKANIIKDILKGEEVHESCSPSFVFWVKKTKIFQLLSLDELDLKDVPCLPAKVKNDNDKTIFSQYRIVAITEKFYDILERIHSTENGHVGYKKTLAEVHKSYECLPRAAVQQFCNTCPICQQKQPQTTNASLKPILASGFLTRCQIDLIDMRHMPDESYQYIATYMDHWSKFHILWPLMKKSAVEVAMGLVTRVFPYFGLPKILHSDNGREFVNEIVQECLLSWPGEVVIVNGRP